MGNTRKKNKIIFENVGKERRRSGWKTNRWMNRRCQGSIRHNEVFSQGWKWRRKRTSGNDIVGRRRRNDADSEVKATSATRSFQYNFKREGEEVGGEETEKRGKNDKYIEPKTHFHLHFGTEPTTRLFTVFCYNGNGKKKWTIKGEFSSVTSRYRNLQ